VRLLRSLFAEPRRAAPARPAAAANPQRARDSQRARVYRAEHAAFMADSALPLRPYGWLTSLAAARAFVGQVAADPAVVARWPDPTRPGVSLLDGLAVTDGRGRRSAASYIGRHAIALPVRYRMRWVALHECAHVIARALHGAEPGYAPHGAEFAGVYLALCGLVLGPDAEARLATAFRAEAVRVR
jgi:putative metallohydrolase (TIGR04338 family)